MQILFPGDIEKAAWEAHLRNQAFVNELLTTTVLVASHHGRENGFSEEAFRILRPQVTVISDKSIVHGTQEMVPDYRNIARGDGILVTNETDRRRVLTTRRDGDMLFNVEANGDFRVTTRVR